MSSLLLEEQEDEAEVEAVEEVDSDADLAAVAQLDVGALAAPFQAPQDPIDDDGDAEATDVSQAAREQRRAPRASARSSVGDGRGIESFRLIDRARKGSEALLRVLFFGVTVSRCRRVRKTRERFSLGRCRKRGIKLVAREKKDVEKKKAGSVIVTLSPATPLSTPTSSSNFFSFSSDFAPRPRPRQPPKPLPLRRAHAAGAKGKKITPHRFELWTSGLSRYHHFLFFFFANEQGHTISLI